MWEALEGDLLVSPKTQPTMFVGEECEAPDPHLLSLTPSQDMDTLHQDNPTFFRACKATVLR